MSGAEREDFCCAICQCNVSMRWSGRGRDEILPPFCAYCEGSYSEGFGRPSCGSFRDRRETVRGLAMAEALRSEAARIKWSKQYGIA